MQCTLRLAVVVAAASCALAGPAGAQGDTGGGAVSLHGPPRPLRLIRGDSAWLSVDLRVRPGFHINANLPSEEWLIGTKLHLEGFAGLETRDVRYPEAREIRVPFEPGTLRIYDGQVTVAVLLRAREEAPVGEQVGLVRVIYQACDDRLCLAPAEAAAAVRVAVLPPGLANR